MFGARICKRNWKKRNRWSSSSWWNSRSDRVTIYL